MEEIPEQLSKLVPFYAGGISHLTYKDVSAWICHVIHIQSCQSYGLLPNLDEERIQLVANNVVDLYSKFPPNPRPRTGPSVGPGPVSGQRPPAKIEVDASELLDIVPMCFKRIMTAKQFPLHWQRLFMLSTFRAAGIDLDTFGDWLEKKNSQYPKDNGQSLNARFAYEYEWKSERSVTEISCRTIFKNTQTGKYERITCPFYEKHKQNVPVDVEDLCKQECLPNPKFPVYGPKQVIKQLNWRMKHGIKKN
jgi:hypothetical protein